MLEQKFLLLKMIRWHHAMTAIPVKYLWGYSQCRSSMPQSRIIACCRHSLPQAQESSYTVWPLHKQLDFKYGIPLTLLPNDNSVKCYKSKRSKSASKDHRPQNLMCLNDLSSTHAAILQSLRNTQVPSDKQLLHATEYGIHDCDFLHEHINSLFSESIILTCIKTVNKADEAKDYQMTSFSTSASINSKEKAKEPADDPKQKLLMLTEKIRSEVPGIFDKARDYHDFSMYTKHLELYVTLKKYKFSTSGLYKYKFVVSLFRRLHLLYLSKADVELLSILPNEEQNTVEVRWRVTGWPPVAVLATLLFRLPANQRYYDYVSTLFVTNDGLIWRHDVTKIRRLSDGVPFRTRVEALRQRTIGAVASCILPHASSNFRYKHRLSNKNVQT
ncbi:unnamed protein product [Clavelina lepadiformis]|uniref:Uncharacterized protein n=1 Tax=Clavelina lepadiformis TaxID=159417 RepID=A0ABP0F7T1_CLALP